MPVIIAISSRNYKKNEVSNIFCAFTEFFPDYTGENILGVGLATVSAASYDEKREDIQLWPVKTS